MSRLIVKNLPKNVTSQTLTNLFSAKGYVTDVQLKYTSDGKFRHFGFVGFKTPDEARAACDYFDNTFVNSCKIKTEICAELGDKNKPRAWSKYAKDSSAFKAVNENSEEKISKEKADKDKDDAKKKKKTKKNVKEELLEKYKDDETFAEFMKAHTKSGKGIWSNDELIPSLEVKKDSDRKQDSEAEEDDDKETEQAEDEKVKEEVEATPIVPSKPVKEKRKVDLFNVSVRGLPFKAKKKEIKTLFHPLKPKSIFLPRKVKGLAYVGFGTEQEMKQALRKHQGFFSGKRLNIAKHIHKHTDIPSSNTNSRWIEQEEALKGEEEVAESGRMFVRNLAYTVKEEDLEKLFGTYGPLSEVNVPVDRYTRKIKGFAFVTFVIPEHAVKAYTELDGSILQGRMLHLLPGKVKLSPEELLDLEGLSFKQKKELQLKKQAQSSHNWNTLFLGANAIADVMAKTYGTTKEKILDDSGRSSAAVRLALGETQIVSQTRDFLTENGVALDAFSQPPKVRSKRVILVKNLPAETEATELQTLFSKHGVLGRLLLPPSSITAIVEFLEPSEARAAFRKLAYSKFHHVPLYLEWAPDNVFATPESVKTSKKDKPEDGDKNEDGDITEASKEKDEVSDNDDIEAEPDSTLFVKNLNFDTTEVSLIKHFERCGKIKYATVARKKDPKNPGQLLSMGYGFIQFKRKASSEEALKTLQGKPLDEHALELKRSNRTLQSEAVTARKKAQIGKQTGTKILVRNIPFQATKQEIAELFKTFGEIKAIRLPQKMVGTGPHRGFAFVDFFTKDDAKRALQALCHSTHLYGRRLVLEWASEDDTVEDLRRKTAKQFHDGPSGKKKKFEEVLENAGNEDE